MSSDVVIQAENISKSYRLGAISSRTLSEDLSHIWNRMLGKEHLTHKIGEEKKPKSNMEDNFFWALQDINFELKKGDVLGVIGKNGAGKSTLLKILSQITQPTTGEIKIKGKVASLLEVGTGFHPELSGRENIFLNGAILGMRKNEIQDKFDEIVDFSGVEKFIDTPVKRYSSGMYVRLAFAVAAHLEPEILIIDEVLAVGDAEFQKRCLGKMKDVAGQGRTVIFVSHNLSAVKELCGISILLKSGFISKHGATGDVLKEYLSVPIKLGASDFLNDLKLRRGNGEVRFTNIIINGGNLTSDPSEETKIHFFCSVLEDVSRIDFTFFITSGLDRSSITSSHLIPLSNSPVKKGNDFNFSLVIPKNTFRTGLFPLYLWVGRKGDLAAENYHYDCIDSLFYLNFSSQKNKQELGYDPLEPNGLVNIDFKIENSTFETRI